MTGEDLEYRPSVLEQTKFDYSPLGKVFNKGLDDKDDKKERLLKRLFKRKLLVFCKNMVICMTFWPIYSRIKVYFKGRYFKKTN